MNRDNICRMAQEVSGVEFPIPMDGVKIGMSMEHLERFAHLVAAAEREACAEACERAVGSASMYQDVDAANSAYRIKNYCQKLIRTRGQG